MPVSETLQLISNHPLNRAHRCRAWLRCAGWQLRSRIFAGDHVLPWVNATRLRVHRGEKGLTGNIYCGLHEFYDMAFLLHFLGAEDLFVDVGANAGAYSVLAGGVCCSHVLAVEPVPATFERLSGNLKLNELEGRVQAMNIGLSDTAGTLRFTSSLDCINHVATEQDPLDACVSVPVSTLDEIVGARKPKLIKIDVEGYETPVLLGARETLASASLAAIIVETNQSGNRYGFSDEGLMEILREHGFTPAQYDPFVRTLTLAVDRRPQSGNTLFVRAPATREQGLKNAPEFAIYGNRV